MPSRVSRGDSSKPPRPGRRPPRFTTSRAGRSAANGRQRRCIAKINQAAYDIRESPRSGLANIVAICGPRFARLDKARDLLGGQEIRRLSEKLFDRWKKGSDAASWRYPDHHHPSPPAGRASAGKQVYCEKTSRTTRTRRAGDRKPAAKAKVADSDGGRRSSRGAYGGLFRTASLGAIGAG